MYVNKKNKVQFTKKIEIIEVKDGYHDNVAESTVNSH